MDNGSPAFSSELMHAQKKSENVAVRGYVKQRAATIIFLLNGSLTTAVAKKHDSVKLVKIVAYPGA